jgi:hypothetical protein
MNDSTLSAPLEVFDFRQAINSARKHARRVAHRFVEACESGDVDDMLFELRGSGSV